jgi:hypothetical protein
MSDVSLGQSNLSLTSELVLSLPGCPTSSCKDCKTVLTYVVGKTLESQGTGIDMSLQIHNDLDWVSIQQNDSEIGPWIK